MAKQSQPVQKRRSAPATAQKRSVQTRKPGALAPEERVFDYQTRRDICAVVLIIVAIALFICAVMPTDGIITGFLSEALHLSLGQGAVLVPLFLGVIGVTLLIRFERQRVPSRVAIGLAIILVAILGLIGLSTPIQNGDYSQFFLYMNLINHGGYFGAALAWSGCTLFGVPITAVILVGIIIVGIVTIGFSISALIEKIRGLHGVSDEGHGPSRLGSLSIPFARILRRHDSQPVEPAPPMAAGARRTAVLGGRKEPKAAFLKDEGAHEGDDGGSSAAVTRVLGGKADSAADARQASVSDANPEAEAGESASRTRVLPAVGSSAQAMTRKLGSSAPSSDETAAKPAKQPKARTQASPSIQEPSADEDGYSLPSFSLLAHRSGPDAGIPEEELAETAALLQETLEDFGVNAGVVGWVAGPTVTLFKVDLPSGVRVSKVTGLSDDIALALAAPGVRIFAPIPGTNYVGIEVPNKTRQTVLLTDVLKDAGAGPLQIAIGKDVEGHSIVTDLAKMPHLLIGGTTGSGKSVSINAMIMSILMRATPSEVRFIMVDPKRVEFTPYNGIPHLYVPVVTEAKEAAGALSWGVAEMERRLKVFAKAGVRNIGQFNEKTVKAHSEYEAAKAAGEDPEPVELEDKMPYIVIIIDELADLMMNVGKEVEFSISRIAQLARAAGIHLIVATQRPSAKVVTGLIKANITNRIAFNVASGIDSRVILDTPGAESLIGLGDLLFSKPEYSKPQRIQGCFVSESEIEGVVEHLKSQGEPEYHSEILKTNVVTLGDSSPSGGSGEGEDDDPLLWEAAEIVVSSNLGSTSNIQRRLKVGYARAGRIMDQLEDKGVVGPANGSRPRDVLVDEMELETLKAFEAADDDGAPYYEE